MTDAKWDVVVLGGGPGGYVAAIRAAQLGNSVACIEADRLGGVCGNWGCIPAKALLESAGALSRLPHLEEMGIRVKGVEADLRQAVARSRAIADRASGGVAHLFRKSGIHHVEGRGRITDRGAIMVRDPEGNVSTLTARHLVLATGARPRDLPALPIDHRTVWDSTDAMLAEIAPASLIVLGAGPVGCEFADVFAAFGTGVTLLEQRDRILPLEDQDCSAVVERSFRARGIQVHTGIRIEGAAVADGAVTLRLRRPGDEVFTVEAERALSAVGRAPNVEDIGLDQAGVMLRPDGFIRVDGQMRTSAEGIWAVGDLTGPPLLAHKAFHEGMVCAESIRGMTGKTVDRANIPSCTYCHPEVASVGLTEARAREEGYPIDVGVFPLQASGRALTMGESEGFVKVVRDRRYSAILGVHIVGPHASELIAEATLGRSLESTVEWMAHAIHPHPTLSEAIGEAALAAIGRPLHI